MCICACFCEFISLARDPRDSKFLLLVLHHCLPLCQGVKGSQGLFQPAESLGQGQLADLWTCSNTHTSMHTEKHTRHIQCKADWTGSPMLENRLSVFSLSAGTPQSTSGPVIVRDGKALCWLVFLCWRSLVLDGEHNVMGRLESGMTLILYAFCFA